MRTGSKLGLFEAFRCEIPIKAIPLRRDNSLGHKYFKKVAVTVKTPDNGKNGTTKGVVMGTAHITGATGK